MQDFRALRVWQKSHELAVALYASTAKFPREELYGLTSQIRRAAVSIPANIAEGCGRVTAPDMAHFLQVAMGSANEVDYLLLLARDLGLVNGADHGALSEDTTHIKRMLATLIQRVKHQGQNDAQASGPEH